MAHYAICNQETKVVEQVITGREDNENVDEGFSTWEEYYSSKFPDKLVKQTSYNTRANQHILGGTPFRGNYAAIGGTYDVDNDVFIPKKIKDNAVWDTSTCSWKPPTDAPDDGNDYIYNWETDEWEQENLLPNQFVKPDDGNNYFWNEETVQWELEEYQP